jgi:hypothetical protein
MTLVKSLLDLPTQIRKGDFVLKLSEGIARPAETVASYVVTPALAGSFDQALGLVASALRDGRSVAAFLHGSFGSGKSHFMALLSLMLDGAEEAWRVPELHPFRRKYEFIGKAKLLQLRFHMVGHSGDLEDAIFARYVGYVREHHPEADLPGLFADEQLFADAERLCAELGDDAFFAPMNAGTTVAEGWGALGQAALWSRERFDQARQSADPAERASLFNALVKTRFGSFAQESRAFVDLDSGLATMASHAAGLGYHGIVLFLDELVLWLAGRASDAAWLHTEAQKMVKLVEAQESRRAIPFVSLIARQRDLAEMVGDTYAGAENLRLRESLQWGKGRYDIVTLEDRNLPAIVERRVRKPKDAEAEKALGRGFEELKRAAGVSWDTLLGQQDADAFKKLYPFSPALVEALVALSNSLQRERTAIKLLMEILVEHIENLKLGEVVGVGELFDVLAGGEDTADGIMRSRFEAAKQLYRYQLLPVIQQSNGTTTEARCQRLRPDHPTRLGCANCPERACHSDNQLAKTLIIAALVPEVPALKNLTVTRLVRLNHGALKVPIPGTEANLALGRIKDWASQVGQAHIGDGADPKIWVDLEGVDLKPILDQGRSFDSDGARQRVLRDLLFEAMGVAKIADTGKDHVVDWRGSRRLGHIRFANVRTLGPEQLRCPDDHDWNLVVDFPFDKPGHGPNDDEAALEAFVQQGVGTWTLVWLPSFFSKAMNDLLGELVIVEQILESTATLRGFISHLSVESQGRARVDLDSLRSQKRARLMQALEQAYGLAAAREGDLDESQSVEKHLRVLKPGVQLQPDLAANLNSAVDQYISALLAARYPRHPHLSHKLTKQRVELLVAQFGELVDSEDKSVSLDRELHEELAGTLGLLGLVHTPEGRARLREDSTLQQLENKRRQLGVDPPTVGQLRAWMDENRKMGLKLEAEDLVVRCYARSAARTLVRLGKPFGLTPGQPLPDDVELEKPELPSHADWAAALNMAGHTFGITLAGKALHADNLKRFEALLQKALEPAVGPCTALPPLLHKRGVELGVPDQADRSVTARSADALCAGLADKAVVQQVTLLAHFEPHTSSKAVGESIVHAPAVARVLGEELVFGVFGLLRAKHETLAGAAELLEQAAQALRQDELNLALAPRLRALAEEGQRLLQPKDVAVVAATGKALLVHTTLTGKGGEAVRERLKKALAEVESALAEADELELSGELVLRGRKKP